MGPARTPLRGHNCAALEVSRRLTGSKGGGAMQWFMYDLRHLPFGTPPRTLRMLACFASLLFGIFAVLSLPVEVGASSTNVFAGPTDLGTLGGTSSGAIAVSGSGQVVGESTTAGDTAIHAFSWTAGGDMVSLGTFGGTFSGASAVNASGQVVGQSATSGNAATHAFSWTSGGGMVDLGTLGGTRSIQTIQGSAFEGNGGGVNNRGQVVGESSISGDSPLHAFSWTSGGGMVDLGTLGGTESVPFAVNSSGQVVGGSSTTGDTASHAFSWTSGGGMVDLDTLGGTFSEAIAVNGRGQVVGGSSTTGDTTSHAFSWTAGGGMVDLGTLPGGQESGARAMNARGQVVGDSSTSTGAIHAVLWQPA